MNIHFLTKCAAASVLLSIAGICGAHSTNDSDGSMLLAYRADDGSIDPESAQNAAEMRRIAARDGYITLWILPIAVGMDETESDAKGMLERTCTSIVGPLASRGLVSVPSSRSLAAANTCLVRASPASISLLLHDDRVKQVMGAK